jgi:flagellar P-ring protein FlgI
MKLRILLVVMVCATLLEGVVARASEGSPARLKELAALAGVRDNQLIGYGLAVGLAGTGDKRQTVFSAQTLANMLEKMGVSVDPQKILVRNTAAVLVTAILPPYSEPGNRIDVTVAAVGDATSLQGGLLLMTPMKAANGQVYALAQGPVITGGFVAGRGGNSTSVNHPTAGLIMNGAIVETGAPTPLTTDILRWRLKQSDFTTAARVAAAVNARYATEAGPVATAENAGVVNVVVPQEFRSRSVEFVSALENIEILADRPARIVINERTGTIVMGQEVRIAPVSILHGALTIEIATTLSVSQPAPFRSGGETVVVPETEVDVMEEQARNISLGEGATVEELTRALLAIGATPRDVIAILQNLKAAGALTAEVQVI